MVVTWIIMAVLTLLAIVFVRNLKVENPGKKQLALEAFISFLDDFLQIFWAKKAEDIFRI